MIDNWHSFYDENIVRVLIWHGTSLGKKLRKNRLPYHLAMFDKLAIIERIVCYQRSAFYELYLQFHVFLKTFLHLAQVALLAVRYFLMLLSNWYSRQNSMMVFFLSIESLNLF